MKLQEKDFEIYYSSIDDPKGQAATAIDTREKLDRRRVGKLLLIGTLLIGWQGVWVPTNQYNFEQIQTKIQYEAYISGYENGWDDQCSAIFSRLGGTGNLAFGKGIAITYPQCLSLKLATSAKNSFNEEIGGYIRDSSAYEMRESGRNQANDAVLTKMFSISPYWCYGNDCISSSDFGIFRPK